jgi:hypothetical protein
MNGEGLFIGLLLILIFGVATWCWGYTNGTNDTLNTAVKNGAGEWSSDKDGKAKFVFINSKTVKIEPEKR